MSKEYIDGLIVKKQNANTPDFIKFKLSIKRLAMIDWLMQKEEEWINADIKESKDGKFYVEVDNWKSNKETHQEVEKEEVEEYPTEDEINPDDIPF